jgi:hypothetical protein
MTLHDFEVRLPEGFVGRSTENSQRSKSRENLSRLLRRTREPSGSDLSSFHSLVLQRICSVEHQKRPEAQSPKCEGGVNR